MPSSFLFLLASLIWGSTFWAITLQLGQVPPAVSVAYRFALASAALFAFCLLRGDRLRLPWRTQRWLMAQGFMTFGLSYICTYNAEQYLVSGLVAVLFALMVFWTPLCARLLSGTPIGWQVWAAGSVAVAGVVLLFSHALAGALRGAHAGSHFVLGLLLALAATIASSAGNVMVGKVRAASPNVFLTTAWSMAWGTALVLVLIVLTGTPLLLPAAPRYWMGLFYLSLFGSVIAFIAYFTLINRIGPQKAVYVGVTAPVISVLLSIRLEHYRPGPLEWLGMLVCLSSVVWAVRHPAKPASLPAVAVTAAPAAVPMPASLSTSLAETL